MRPSQHLYGDIEAGDIEGLEHDLGCVLAILRRVHRRLRQHKVVFLGLASKVLEDAPLPELLHKVPVVDLHKTEKGSRARVRCWALQGPRSRVPGRGESGS